MKLIFLDIDGVMNHRNYFRRSRLHDLQEFCPVAVRNLREIIKRTGAKIVISSTWRKFNDIDYIMSCYDLDQYVVGKTPNLIDHIRGDEIDLFIKRYFKNTECIEKLESFIIIDDDDDMGDLMPHLIHCKDNSGLTDERREEAVELLERNF